MAGSEPLKAPFPWFGGKSRVAHIVWEYFHDVDNYVEPFAGSGTTLLAAKLLGLNYIGIEIDYDTYQIAKKRLEQTTLDITRFCVLMRVTHE